MTAELRFDPDWLLAEASRQADGLQDFGDASFRPALEKLCHSLETEAKLSPLGRQLLHGKFIELLINRLRIEDYFQRHPEINRRSRDRASGHRRFATHRHDVVTASLGL